MDIIRHTNHLGNDIIMSDLIFNPILSPKEMLEAGIFGGSYFGVEDLQGDYDYQSLFAECLEGINPLLYLGKKYSPKMNKFKIRSGMPYDYWLEMDWMHHDDPYGWFEWYCKYSNGRRHEDDNRQIRRWQDFCGPGRGRWRNAIYKKIHLSGDWTISPRIQQSLLHWGYYVNDDDYLFWCELNRVEPINLYNEDEWCEYGGLPSPKAYE